MGRQTSSSSRRRFARRLAAAALVLVVGVAVLEVGLQLAARLVGDRASAWHPNASNKILCVGDSHTYGAGVPRDRAYPAQLQELLDAREPGVHSVVNLGLPGMSSTQLRNRVPVWLQRYRPGVLVVWVGVNDAWNRAEVGSEAGGTASLLDAALSRSRLYRLVRVALHDRDLGRYTAKGREDRAWHVTDVDEPLVDEVWTVRHDGVTERIAHGRHEQPPGLPDGREVEMAARLDRDLAAVAGYARLAGVPMVLVTYPLEVSWFHVVNRVARRIAGTHDLALVETAVALARVPEDERDWTGVAHPGPTIYREIAEEIAPVVAAASEAQDLRERFPPKTPRFRMTRPFVYEPVVDAAGRVLLATGGEAGGS